MHYYDFVINFVYITVISSFFVLLICLVTENPFWGVTIKYVGM